MRRPSRLRGYVQQPTDDENHEEKKRAIASNLPPTTLFDFLWPFGSDPRARKMGSSATVTIPDVERFPLDDLGSTVSAETNPRCDPPVRVISAADRRQPPGTQAEPLDLWKLGLSHSRRKLLCSCDRF